MGIGNRITGVIGCWTQVVEIAIRLRIGGEQSYNLSVPSLALRLACAHRLTTFAKHFALGAVAKEPEFWTRTRKCSRADLSRGIIRIQKTTLVGYDRAPPIQPSEIIMQSKKMEEALNKQINEELHSAYVYLAMAAEADRMGLPGFTNWFKMQYQEELAHADRFFNFILERDGEVQLDAIAKPEVNNETPLSLFEKALEHEMHISQCIFNLKELAREEKDFASDAFLEWFVNEQVEEEANARGVIDQLKLVDGNPNGLFMIDRELAARKPEPEAG